MSTETPGAPEVPETPRAPAPSTVPETQQTYGTASMDGGHVTTTTRDPVKTAELLQSWLSLTLGLDRRPVIADVTSPESTGMSSETVLFTATWDEGRGPVEHRLVARIEPPTTAYPLFTAYDLGMQFRVMRLVGEYTGVPVPRTLWYEQDPAVLGSPFFVMERVDGQVPPDVLPYTFDDNWVADAGDAGRRTLQESAVAALAGIHSITSDAHDLGFLHVEAPGPTSLDRLLHRWREYAAWVVGTRPSPLLAECFDWLDEHRPSGFGPDALSWGDARIGNMLFRHHRVVAVLDWEMAAVAPPEVDLGWMCYLHLFFQDIATDLGIPGLPDMLRPVDVARSYAEVSGYTPADLTWFVAFAAIRHGAIMRRVTERAVYFGEAVMPDDVDDLIIHRATLQGMLDGSYWGGISL
jgi:aminoglycoside phosphotransferase (APT) family kinase protein